jgi:hypothetical protein
MKLNEVQCGDLFDIFFRNRMMAATVSSPTKNPDMMKNYLKVCRKHTAIQKKLTSLAKKKSKLERKLHNVEVKKSDLLHILYPVFTATVEESNEESNEEQEETPRTPKMEPKDRLVCPPTPKKNRTYNLKRTMRQYDHIGIY